MNHSQELFFPSSVLVLYNDSSCTEQLTFVCTDHAIRAALNELIYNVESRIHCVTGSFASGKTEGSRKKWPEEILVFNSDGNTS